MKEDVIVGREERESKDTRARRKDREDVPPPLLIHTQKFPVKRNSDEDGEARCRIRCVSGGLMRVNTTRTYVTQKKKRETGNAHGRRIHPSAEADAQAARVVPAACAPAI